MMTYAESPVPVATEMQALIVHATLKIGSQIITGADVPWDRYLRPQGFAVQLNVDDAEEAQRVFDTLAEGGMVHLPMARTFWAERYGVFTDRFGIPWEINCSSRA